MEEEDSFFMGSIWVKEEDRAILNERYDLAVGRVREIEQEPEVPACFVSYVRKTAQFILLMDDIKTKLESGYFEDHPEELAACNRKMYEDILPENYGSSFANPEYAARQLGEALGKLLCFLYAQVRGLITYVYEGKEEETTAHVELFVQVCGILRQSAEAGQQKPGDEAQAARSVRDALYWFESDYADVIIAGRIREQIDPDCDFAADIIMNSDLNDLNYLYRYGEYITDSEITTAKYLNSLPQDEIDRMADTWSEGYRMGFVYAKKPLEKKRTVNLHYHVGFERVVRKAIENFEKMNLRPTIFRYGASALTVSSAYRSGFTGAAANPQYDYDHREDAALMMDAKFAERRIEVAQSAYEEMKDLAAAHGGPAVMETFGEDPFEPVSRKEAWTYDDKQQKIQVKMRMKLSQIVNKYIIGSERSFTIIAFPLPDIAASGTGAVRQIDTDRYKKIFDEIIKVNTLDVPRYTKIQERLIDALNKGTCAHILGAGSNRTDLTVQFHSLSDPEKETIFENCGADVNIPLGEVFTSPVLKGTNGILHVSQVYLNGLNFRDLEIHFKDGMIESASCSNFEKQEDNDAYIRDNILFHHDTLPMGEFAIGTNTTAYAAARKFGIASRLPILIAEKTGPHFAVGDTCYSWEEDVRVFNPDGREIVAKDNEISILRKEDPSKAYFQCHTDITIPYEELGLIEAAGENGYRAELIRDGRFVLPGTEELNEALDKVH